MSQKILIVDDEIDICQLLSRFLGKHGYETSFVTTGKKGLAEVEKNRPDLILCDFRLPDMDGSEAIKAFKKIDHSLKIIIITGYSDVKTAVTCVKLGASEYVIKPIFPEEILLSVKTALKEQHVVQEKSDPSKPKKKNPSYSENKEYIEGESQNARKLQQVIKLLSPTNMSVIIQGESGTGKEMVANAIHRNSARKDKPFVAIDCGALPKELAASELFGHVKGSFTGAINNKTGHFEMANGGTLFLDEIGNLSYENQIKLLRVLQERKIRKIGDNKDIPIDVRLIAASNDNLEELAKEGEFREDLFYRLNEFLVDVAPLRERREDILIYAERFLEKANQELEREVNSLSPEVIDVLKNYKWHGNIRELRNVIKRAVLLTEGDVMKVSALPSELSSVEMNSSFDTDDNEIVDLKTVAERAERKAIITVLERNNYNKTKTAKALKIDRKTLYNKLESYDIQLKKSFQ